MNLFAKLSSWLLDRFTDRRRYQHVEVEDLPEVLEPWRLYLVGEDGINWAAAFLCPCGCRAIIQLSLIPHDKPSWRATTSRGRITLHPSVWRVTGCQSHFFIREGKLIWSR